MKKLNLLFLGFSFALISGCATARFTKTGETYPKYEGPVKVFAEIPEGIIYAEIGRVTSKKGLFSDDATLIKALRKKAAKKGANAIILVSNRYTRRAAVSGVPSGPYGFYGNLETSKDMTAIAIRITNRNER